MVHLDQFLIFVEFFQLLDVHVGEIHRLGLITVLLVPQSTCREFGVGIRLTRMVPKKHLSF